MIFGNNRIHHFFFQCLILRCNLTFQIQLHHQLSDRHSERCPETAILDIYADSDFRIFIRSETDKSGMILSMRIFGRTGFSAYFNARYRRSPTSPSQYCITHTFCHYFIIF